MRILLVEDHEAMRTMTATHLREAGFAVDEAATGDEGLSAARAQAYAALIIDRGLPDVDGLTLVRAIRSGAANDIPILILTARSQVSDRVAGLNGGADDYIVKPFELVELEARLRAVLRRPGPRGPELYRFGDITLDPSARVTKFNGVELELTRRELTVLEELIRAKGAIVVKDALEDRIYGFHDEIRSNALEAAVSRVRRKLALAGSRVGIEAYRGLGYRLMFKWGKALEG
ncbi:MAG: hypothetical protein B7Z80_01685 [Rhodospirillales bacterium 20-64-7]|nr:MAG: hypothetical protein B7Z80_01685 [Rhodospirillales bacterium 20-64-7]